MLLPETLVANTNCAHPQPSECNVGEVSPYQGHWVLGLHHGSDSKSGRDEWRLSIGPGWQLERVDWWHGLGLIDVVPQPRGAGGQVVFATWRSAQDPYAFDSSEWYFRAQYGMRFHVTGPAGVPFAAGIN